MELHIEGNWITKEVTVNGKPLNPKKSQAVINHSPDGFNWGYNGSGPAQLALAILLEVFPKEVAVAMHQDFKEDFVASLQQNEDFGVEIEFQAWQSTEGYTPRYSLN